jgi:hypothetical protein
MALHRSKQPSRAQQLALPFCLLKRQDGQTEVVHWIFESRKANILISESSKEDFSPLFLFGKHLILCLCTRTRTVVESDSFLSRLARSVKVENISSREKNTERRRLKFFRSLAPLFTKEEISLFLFVNTFNPPAVAFSSKPLTARFCLF